MRIFTKEFLAHDQGRLIKPSIQIVMRRYMPKNKRCVVTSWSGWPMEPRMYHGKSMSKSEAVAMVNNLLKNAK